MSNSEASWAKSSFGLGKLALLDGLDDDLDLGGFAGVLAADEGGVEDGVLVGAEAGDGLVQAFEHGAGADLVGQAGSGVNLGAVDGGGDVDGEEVAVGGRAVHGLQRAEAAAQFVQGLVDVGVGGLGGGNLNLDAGVVRAVRSRGGRRPRRGT